MEKRERKPGYFARLKRRRQLKQSQSEKSVTEQSQSEKSVSEQPPAKSPLKSPIISCPDAPNDLTDPKDKAAETGLQRITAKLPDDTSSRTKKEKKRPPGTVEFIVGPTDTLNSIALKFNITPNKLVQLNKLFSRSVYPGQKLFVPDVSQSEADSESKDSCHPASTNGVSEKGSHDGESNDRSGKPLRRELSPPSEDESPATVKFIKMSCKYFTDGMGVVGGVMIVTPNNIMFDPHKSDPLVIENGCEEYGLICPMEEVMSVALYDDVSRMNLKDALPSDLPQDLCPVYRPGEWERLPSERDLNPFSRYEALDPKRPIILDDIDSALSESGSAEGEQADKSPSDEGFTELEPTVNGSTEDGEVSSKLRSTEDAEVSSKLHSTEDAEVSSKLHSTEDAEVSSKLHSTEDTEVSSKLHSTEDTEVSSKLHSTAREDQREKALEPCQTEKADSQEVSNPNPVPALSQAKKKVDEEEDEGVFQNSSVEEGIGSLLSTSETEKQADVHEKPTSLEVTEAKDVKSKGTGESVKDVGDVTVTSPADQNRKSSLKETAEAHGKCSPHGPSPVGELQNGPTEEEGLSEEEIRRRNYEAEVKSWLLERMQAPIEDMLHSSEEKSKSPPMFLCFKVGKPMRKSFATGMTSSPAHSFGRRVKQPEYWFAVPQERVDHLYSFFVQWSPDVYGKEAREHGFVVVEKDELDMIDNFFSDPASCSWEIITIDEAKRRQSVGSYEGELSAEGLPILNDTSSLLQDTHIEKLACRLPARVQGYPWKLAYSTVEHGTSLKTMYRSLAEVDSPVLLVIKDMDNQVFGAFSTHPFKMSEHFYGTGETFLYSFCPEIKVYRWTGENSYFVKGNTDSLQMGGGGGQLGLWLDAELYRGTTNSCATFNNQPLSAQQDFNIHSLEVWTFE